MKKRRIIGRIVVFILSLSLVAGYFTFEADYERVKAEESVNSGAKETKGSRYDKLKGSESSLYENKTEPENDNSGRTNYGYIESSWMRDVPAVEEDISLEEVESILTNANGLKSGNKKTEAPLPSAYPYSYTDVEDLNKYISEKLSPLRDQKPYGLCWSFASIATIEQYLLFNRLKDRNGLLTRDTINYSELHLAYFTYHNNTNPLIPGQEDGKVYFSYGTSFLENFGGNECLAIRSLLKWNGAVNENKAAYLELENVKKDPDVMSARKGLSDDIAYRSDDIRLKNGYYINLKKNPDLVKQAIRKNGCVSMGIFMDYEMYYDQEHNSYYNYVDNNANHAVNIVGWDDDFPKENFKKEAGRNGAWLIRNSWMDGTDPGSGKKLCLNGYFWASYDDTSYDNCVVVFETENVDTDPGYDNNYYYTNTIYQDDWFLPGVDKLANVFTVQGEKGAEKETISAVIIETNDSDVDYSISVYSVDEDGNPLAPLNNPTTGIITFRGAYTIELEDPVTLDRGTSFAIVFEGDTDKIVLESDFNYDQILVKTVINHGESLVLPSSDGNDVSWEDLYYVAEGGFGNFCIQALTIDSDIKIPKIEGLKRDDAESTTESIKLSWDSFAGADSYIVYSFDDLYDLSNAKVYEVMENSFIEPDLEPNSRHYYKIVPVISGEEQTKSTSKIITADVKPSYDENTVPEIIINDSDSILGYAGENAEGCIVKYRKKGTSEWKNWSVLYDKEFNLENFWYAKFEYLNNKNPGLYEVQMTPYFYNVHEEIGYGKTVVSDFVIPYAAPENFNAVYNESDGTVSLTWDPVKNASKYELFCICHDDWFYKEEYDHEEGEGNEDDDDNIIPLDVIVEGCSYSHILKDPKPGTEYVYYIGVYVDALEEILDDLPRDYFEMVQTSIITPKAMPDAGLFKLSKSDDPKIYNGQGHAAVIEAINEPVTGGAITIYYKPVGDENAEFTTSLPVDAGKYALMIDVGETRKYFEGKGITDESWFIEILPAELTVIPDEGLLKDFDMQPDLTYKYTGNVLGETPAFTGALSVEDIEGEHRITIGTLALADNESFKAKNYVLKLTDGTVLLTYIGDTNGDGAVTPDDVIYLKHYLAGGYNVNVSLVSADIDRDGLITPMDVTLLERYLAQKDKNVA